MDDYFDGVMPHRQALLWCVAARRQLDRWEAVVARIVRGASSGLPPGPLVWEAESERHLALVAVRSTLRAAKLAGMETEVALETDLNNLRDLAEHWDENMPVFNVWPRAKSAPHRSGKEFSRAHPDETPYSAFAWSSDEGPRLLRSLPSSRVHTLLDGVQAGVLRERPSLAAYVPERLPSPWLGDSEGDNRWWPKPT